MKCSDYIVSFLIEKGITDVFGYPGGMVTHLMDSFGKRENEIHAHMNYHEQASAMAACAWAEIKHLPGVAYATSGPGATNLLTGIACAYFDSVPLLCITGQVNTYEQKGNRKVRQLGFQETDIVAMAAPVTKWAYAVSTVEELPEALEKAFQIAMEGRRGPVLLDIPMDVQRGEIADVHIARGKKAEVDQRERQRALTMAKKICESISCAKRPLILVGHGIELAAQRDAVRKFAAKAGVPVISSMLAVDVFPTENKEYFGFIGAYGARCANFLVDSCDLLLVLGSRLDCRQTGVNKRLFASNAKIIRIEEDTGEFTNPASETEQQIRISLEALMPALAEMQLDWLKPCEWLERCAAAQQLLQKYETENVGNRAAALLSRIVSNDSVVTTDVGQNQVWIAQSFAVKDNQRLLFSGGHGAMGYSLPAAIGVALATRGKVICCTGDGGLQMNIQELQFIVRENLCVKIVVFNNRALGMIHHFQEMYFGGKYVQTDAAGGFTTPDFCLVAQAYGIRAFRCQADMLESLQNEFNDELPLLVELMLPERTHVFPKLGMNKPVHEQEPPLPAEIQTKIWTMLNG